jgi:hypothetical protein
MILLDPLFPILERRDTDLATSLLLGCINSRGIRAALLDGALVPQALLAHYLFEEAQRYYCGG